MGFSIYCIVEACILVANAIAILNDRFLKQGKSISLSLLASRTLTNLFFSKVGFHVDNVNYQQVPQPQPGQSDQDMNQAA